MKDDILETNMEISYDIHQFQALCVALIQLVEKIIADNCLWGSSHSVNTLDSQKVLVQKYFQFSRKKWNNLF